MYPTEGTIAVLMRGFRAGRKESADQLFDILYPELRRMAAARMARERSSHSWQPTLLVNELYLELLNRKALGGDAADASERSAFLGLAGFLMKRLLILHSRPLRQRVERTGVEEIDEAPSAAATPDSLQFVEGLLGKVEAIDPKLRRVVEMRVFEGKSHDEIAGELGCTSRTVGTYWSFVRQMLQNELGPRD
jgi:RNA polymerase sigma factor (TIGR02999 family)